MLVTTCTHCLARFRVTPQQLNARQGQVRCGRCSKVFSGFEALERIPDDDTGARLLAARERDEGGEAAASGEPLPEPLADFEALDLEVTPGAPTEPPSEPVLAAATPATTREPTPASHSPDTSSARTAPAARAKPLSRVALESETARRPRRSPLWSVGSLLLLLVLAGELAFALRAPLAQRYPALRPGLEQACAYLKCTVPWSRDERLLKLEDSQLLEVPGQPNQIALGARLRNLASVAQEYPDLELTLTDISGQAAARRVLRPADYLGHPLGRDEVLAPGAELAVQLRLETVGTKATGYELLLFYP